MSLLCEAELFLIGEEDNPHCSVGRLLPVLMTTLYGSGGFAAKWMGRNLQWERPTLWAGHVLNLLQVSNNINNVFRCVLSYSYCCLSLAREIWKCFVMSCS